MTSRSDDAQPERTGEASCVTDEPVKGIPTLRTRNYQDLPVIPTSRDIARQLGNSPAWVRIETARGRLIAIGRTSCGTRLYSPHAAAEYRDRYPARHRHAGRPTESSAVPQTDELTTVASAVPVPALSRAGIDRFKLSVPRFLVHPSEPDDADALDEPVGTRRRLRRPSFSLPEQLPGYRIHRDGIPKKPCGYNRFRTFVPVDDPRAPKLDFRYLPSHRYCPPIALSIFAAPGTLLTVQQIEEVLRRIAPETWTSFLVSEVEFTIDLAPEYERSLKNEFYPRRTRNARDYYTTRYWRGRRSSWHAHVYPKSEQGMEMARFEFILCQPTLKRLGVRHPQHVWAPVWVDFIKDHLRFVELEPEWGFAHPSAIRAIIDPATIAYWQHFLHRRLRSLIKKHVRATPTQAIVLNAVDDFRRMLVEERSHKGHSGERDEPPTLWSQLKAGSKDVAEPAARRTARRGMRNVG